MGPAKALILCRDSLPGDLAPSLRHAGVDGDKLFGANVARFYGLGAHR